MVTEEQATWPLLSRSGMYAFQVDAAKPVDLASHVAVEHVVELSTAIIDLPRLVERMTRGYLGTGETTSLRRRARRRPTRRCTRFDPYDV
jgi:hypothetical protein